MRTNTSITQSEIAAYAQFCADNNIVHDGSPNDEHNSAFVLDYFTKTWGEDITEANLAQAFPQLKPHLRFQSKAEIELRKTAADSDAVATQKFATWFEKQTFLVKEGEEGFANANSLLQELRGRDVTNETIAAAMGRIEAPTSRYDTRVRRPLHYVTKPRVEADPNYKPGRFIEGANKTASDYARERVAASAKNNPVATDSAKLLEAQARQDAENIRGNSRYQDSILGRIIVFKPGTTDTDWVQTLQSRRAILRTWVTEASGNRSVR